MGLFELAPRTNALPHHVMRMKEVADTSMIISFTKLLILAADQRLPNDLPTSRRSLKI